MTGNEDISIIDEIIGTIYGLEKEKDSLYNNKINTNNKEEKLSEEFNSENNINSEEEDLCSDNIIDNSEDILNIEQELKYVKENLELNNDDGVYRNIIEEDLNNWSSEDIEEDSSMNILKKDILNKENDNVLNKEKKV